MSQTKTVLSGAPVRTQENQQLAIDVAFTSDRETVAVLRHAVKLASGLGARLRIVAPQVVPYAADMDHPPVSPDFTAARMLKLAAQAGVEADVHVVLCRDRAAGLESVLGANAIVMAGENKLTRKLKKRGHHVLVVDGFAGAERES